jgi:hypothetical protein
MKSQTVNVAASKLFDYNQTDLYFFFFILLALELSH